MKIVTIYLFQKERDNQEQYIPFIKYKYPGEEYEEREIIKHAIQCYQLYVLNSHNEDSHKIFSTWCLFLANEHSDMTRPRFLIDKDLININGTFYQITNIQ